VDRGHLSRGALLASAASNRVFTAEGRARWFGLSEKGSESAERQFSETASAGRGVMYLATILPECARRCRVGRTTILVDAPSSSRERSTTTIHRSEARFDFADRSLRVLRCLGLVRGYFGDRNLSPQNAEPFKRRHVQRTRTSLARCGATTVTTLFLAVQYGRVRV